ncbi:hypothetical protein BC628DRAFT_763670 [Trametes gibbosa]|nr:hypothetical protein BC628DRAFT_763670 [Trametes gibbosa]
MPDGPQPTHLSVGSAATEHGPGREPRRAHPQSNLILPPQSSGLLRGPAKPGMAQRGGGPDIAVCMTPPTLAPANPCLARPNYELSVIGSSRQRTDTYHCNMQQRAVLGPLWHESLRRDGRRRCAEDEKLKYPRGEGGEGAMNVWMPQGGGVRRTARYVTLPYVLARARTGEWEGGKRLLITHPSGVLCCHGRTRIRIVRGGACRQCLSEEGGRRRRRRRRRLRDSKGCKTWKVASESASRALPGSGSVPLRHSGVLTRSSRKRTPSCRGC